MLEPAPEQRDLYKPPLSIATLLDNLPGMAYRQRNDPTRTMEYVSNGCVALTGYRPEEFVGYRALSYFQLIHPADRDNVDREIQDALKTGKRYQVTYRIRTATNDEKWVQDQGYGVTRPDGRLVAIEGLITEATSQVQIQQRLEEQAAEHNRQLTTLLEIASNVAATLDLESLLGLILDEVRAAIDYEGAGILILEDGVLVQAAGRGPIPERTAEGIRLRLADADVIRDMIERGEPLVIGDVWASNETARSYRRATSEEWLRARPYIRSWAGVPLQFRDRKLGLLVISYSEADHFTDEHVRILTAVAAQASVAIENARLISAVKETSALEERQRLARDLHDAVTQTLFSASLVGDVLPALWSRDPQRGEEALEDLRILTRGALAEMRTLLFELRPGALIEAPLGDLLQHLAEAVTGRTRTPITVTIQNNQTLPPDVQIAFYRVAQEALNNAVKHAGASRVDLDLAGAPDGTIHLRIHDNGRGFDPENVPAGHFGMATMRERAAAIGATLTVTSALDHGTDVLVVWPGDRSALTGVAEPEET